MQTNKQKNARERWRLVGFTGLVSIGACFHGAAFALTATAGADLTLADTDQQPGEVVALNGIGSIPPVGFIPPGHLPSPGQCRVWFAGRPPGHQPPPAPCHELAGALPAGAILVGNSIVSYRWLNSGNQQIATGASASIRLPDGQQVVTLVVTDATGATATDTINVRISAHTPNRAPIANAGANRTAPDTDGQPGETIDLDGMGSSDPDGNIANYQWLSGRGTVLASGARASVRLADGSQSITLRVTDSSGTSATDTVSIAVGAATAAAAPLANGGPDRTVQDTDAVAGETVALDGSGSTAAGGSAIASYQWSAGGQVIATGATASVRLPDGENRITLTIADNGGNSAVDAFVVAVSPPAGAVTLRADSGPDRRIPDTDSQEGEDVILDGSASAALNGRITTYQWIQAGVPIATGATATVRLADGNNLITLLIFDDSGESASDAIQISVGRALGRQSLSSLPNLTPNQHSLAKAMDAVCARLQDRQSALAGNQRDLLVRCQAIVDSTSTEQVAALDAIAPEELNTVSTETFNLSRLQLTNVTDRLIALRAGAEGLSLAGLRLDTESQSLPVDTLMAGVQDLLGGGASADEAHKKSNARRRRPDRPLGVWMRGNIGTGRKNTNSADRGFDSDQWGVVGGIDYRFAGNKVVGLAAGYGHSSASFNPIGAGSLDTDARTAALYTTMYTRRGFYFDAILSYLQADYESLRGVSFNERASLLDLAARGNTTGSTYSGSLGIGLDQTYWGFTIVSNFGVSYMLTNIEEFREHGAAGLDLLYEEQQYTTAAATAGLRLSYAWKTDIGVFVPQVRGEYVHELSDSAQHFEVRFANDPFDDTPQIAIDSEVPDRSYWRMAAGVSAQFGYGISGFIEHQRLQSHLHIRYTDTVMGVRFESAFQ